MAKVAPIIAIGGGLVALWLLARGAGPGGLRPGQTLTCDMPVYGPVEVTLRERVVEDEIAWWLIFNHETQQEEWITEEDLLQCTGRS